MRGSCLTPVLVLTTTLLVRAAAAEPPPGAPQILHAPAQPPLGPRIERTDAPAMLAAGRVTLGVGLLGLSIGSALGIGALVYHHNIALHCAGDRCSGVLEDDIHRYRQLGKAATASLVAGGALTGVGITLLAVGSRRPKSTAALAPIIGPGFFGVSGRFQ